MRSRWLEKKTDPASGFFQKCLTFTQPISITFLICCNNVKMRTENIDDDFHHHPKYFHPDTTPPVKLYYAGVSALQSPSIAQHLMFYGL